MADLKASGPDVLRLYDYKELPIGAVAIGIDPFGRKTGLWRYHRPEMVEKIPPCQEGCPLGNWIQPLIREIANENFEEAWDILKLENPFSGVCGRVCSHLCDEACNRKELGGSISIKGLERFLADHFWDKPSHPVQPQKAQKKEIAVLGSGPAGMACAYFLALMGYGVTVFESKKSLGGIPRIGIPDYRLPKKILEKEIKDILSMGVEARTGCHVGKDISIGEILKFDGVFLSTGAHVEQPLGIPGENLNGVFRGWDFLQKCNLKQIPPLGKKILVIGGGNVAMDVARSLIRLGHQPIIIYRRTRQEMPAFFEEVEEAMEEGTEFHFLLAPVAIHRRKKKGLRLECSRMKLRGMDESGRPMPVPAKGPHRYFEADQVIIATGERADLSYLPEEFKRQNGNVWINPWGQTSVPHVFSGGDMTDTPRTVAHAISSAKRAAIAMDQFFKGNDFIKLTPIQTMREYLGLNNHRVEYIPEIVKPQDLHLAYCKPREIPVSHKLPLDQRQRSFKEVNKRLSSEEVIREAQQCLSCGVCKLCSHCYLFCPDGAVQLSPEGDRYLINYDYCKGCNICQNECPVGAIHVRPEKED